MHFTYMRTQRLNMETFNNEACLIIQIENLVEITVDGDAGAGYKLTLRAMVHDGNPVATVLAAAQGDKTSEEFWGTALIWASPATIAHLVQDFLDSY